MSGSRGADGPQGRGDRPSEPAPRNRPDRTIPRNTSAPSVAAGTQARAPSAGGARPAHDPDRDGAHRPAKRARKAINCEPCRTSKLKCDRTRPCSSCVLRGTTASCYTDSTYVEEHGIPDKVDPVAEFASARQSLALLEAHFIGTSTRRGAAAATGRNALAASASAPALPSALKEESPELQSPSFRQKSVPGILAQQGTYTGPTSAAMSLLNLRSNSSSSESDGDNRVVSLHGRDPSSAGSIRSDKGGIGTSGAAPFMIDYDRDLIDTLPHVQIIDELIDSYFRICNWVYKHVNEPSFRANWAAFKDGQNPDRIILSQACVLMAIAIYYLPATHALLQSASGTRGDLSKKYYDVMTVAMRRQNEVQPRTSTLEMMELLLSRSHYLYMSKSDAEEQWQVRGELVSMGTSMGLHRDPGNWKMSRELAERRRWVWWHIILFERWTAFTLGRPLSIAAHHYDTMLPSCDKPNIRLGNDYYLPNVSLMQLAVCLGEIMDDAVSVRPVPYDSVLVKDRMLQDWYDGLPENLKLDEFQLSRALAAPNRDERRLGVQSVIIRVAYYNIRFTLHRPHAVPPDTRSGTGSPTPSATAMSALAAVTAQSLSTAVRCGGDLVKLVSQASPDVIAQMADDVPGHFNWGPFHLFSAAMFFLFQLIADPEQPGAGLFRDHVRRAMSILEQARLRNMPVAAKALGILKLVEPLTFKDGGTERERKKKQVLEIVRSMAFPCHDTPPIRPSVRSPRGEQRPLTGSSGQSSGQSNFASSLSPDPPVGEQVGLGVPMNKAAPSNPSQYQNQLQQQQQQQQHQNTQVPRAYPHPLTASPYGPTSAHQPPTLSHSTTHPPPPHPLTLTSTGTSLSYQYQSLPPNPYATVPPPQSGPVYPPQPQTSSQSQPGPSLGMSGAVGMDMSMDGMDGGAHGHGHGAGMVPMSGAENWGHTVGLGPDQWAQLLDVMQRPDSGGSIGPML